VVDELGAGELQVGAELPQVTDVLQASGVVASKSAARRAVSEGGAYLNNLRVTDAEARLEPDQLLHGRFVVARRGKKTVGAVTLHR
jgi:tyrosyl-tRNA synthetase